MIALRWRDVDWEHGLLTIEKSASMAKNRNKAQKEDKNFIMIEGDTKNQKARVEEIAAYIGDLESTTRKYYIAIRKKLVTESGTRQIVKLPDGENKQETTASKI